MRDDPSVDGFLLPQAAAYRHKRATCRPFVRWTFAAVPANSAASLSGASFDDRN
jgi:hypothetical protein